MDVKFTATVTSVDVYDGGRIMVRAVTPEGWQVAVPLGQAEMTETEKIGILGSDGKVVERDRPSNAEAMEAILATSMLVSRDATASPPPIEVGDVITLEISGGR